MCGNQGDNLWESDLSFHHTAPEDQTRDVRLGDKHLPLLPVPTEPSHQPLVPNFILLSMFQFLVTNGSYMYLSCIICWFRICRH